MNDQLPRYALKFMRELVTLNVSDCGLSCLPSLNQLLEQLPNLQHLDVSDNKEISWLSPSYAGLPDKRIHANLNNTVTNLSWMGQIPKGTDEIYLWNQLSQHFHGVEALDLSHNGITCIPTEEFVKFQQLKIFNFQGNQYSFGMKKCSLDPAMVTGKAFLFTDDIMRRTNEAGSSMWDPFRVPKTPPHLHSIDFTDNDIASTRVAPQLAQVDTKPTLGE